MSSCCSIEPGAVETRLVLKEEHLAPNDFLHAGTVITLADTSAGMGCLASLPEGAGGFTTIELKTNFLATAREGALRCSARLIHGGGRTQVWDATVAREEDERVIALFRCTQFLLPKEDDPHRAPAAAADGPREEDSCARLGARSAGVIARSQRGGAPQARGDSCASTWSRRTGSTSTPR